MSSGSEMPRSWAENGERITAESVNLRIMMDLIELARLAENGDFRVHEQAAGVLDELTKGAQGNEVLIPLLNTPTLEPRLLSRALARPGIWGHADGIRETRGAHGLKIPADLQAPYINPGYYRIIEFSNSITLGIFDAVPGSVGVEVERISDLDGIYDEIQPDTGWLLLEQLRPVAGRALVSTQQVIDANLE